MTLDLFPKPRGQEAAPSSSESTESTLPEPETKPATRRASTRTSRSRAKAADAETTASTDADATASTEAAGTDDSAAPAADAPAEAAPATRRRSSRSRKAAEAETDEVAAAAAANNPAVEDAVTPDTAVESSDAPVVAEAPQDPEVATEATETAETTELAADVADAAATNGDRPPRERERGRRGGRDRRDRRGGEERPPRLERESFDEPAASSARHDEPRRDEPRRDEPRRGNGSPDARIDALVRAVEQQSRQIESLLRSGSSGPPGSPVGGAVAPPPRTGVFVDVANVELAADRQRVRLDWGAILNLLTRGRQLVRAVAYAPVHDDPSVSVETQRFVEPFLDKGYKVVTKPLKRFQDGSIKANVDIELALDVVTMADRLDIVVLVSGDGDFQRLVELVQTRGVRVEVAGFGSSTAGNLKQAADSFIDLQARLREIRA